MNFTRIIEIILLLEQQYQVSFRPSHHHRISAQSGSTAYSSMRSDSMNVESALFLPSNHSSMVCIFFSLNFFLNSLHTNQKISSAQHPSASPYEYDCISNENIR
jgi:hypothetical protein